MPTLGGVLSSHFCTLGGKNSGNGINSHKEFPSLFPDNIMIQLKRSLCDFKLPNGDFEKN